MLPLVIVNPHSASGSTRSNWSSIASDLRTHFGPFKVVFTKAAGDGERLARHYASDGRKFIIACGGDGTINEVANGIIDSGAECELGVLPSGTGGDFRRTLGMPTEHRQAARALREGHSRLIDAGRVSFVSHSGDQASRYFLNVSSFGLAAAVIERLKTRIPLEWLPLGSLRGRAGFALSTLQEIAGGGARRVRVRVDDGDEKVISTVNFCLANARYFGGGMLIAPDAKLSDGALDLVNIGDMRTARIFLNGYTLYRGTHLHLPEVHSSLVHKVEARPFDDEGEVHIEVDGELPGKLPAVYEIVPKALTVRSAV